MRPELIILILILAGVIAAIYLLIKKTPQKNDEKDNDLQKSVK